LVTGVAYGPLEKRDGDLLNQQRTSAREEKRNIKFYQTTALDPPARDVWYYIGWRSIFHERGTKYQFRQSFSTRSSGEHNVIYQTRFAMAGCLLPYDPLEHTNMFSKAGLV
jgi:hypothetical protein